MQLKISSSEEKIRYEGEGERFKEKKKVKNNQGKESASKVLRTRQLKPQK